MLLAAVPPPPAGTFPRARTLPAAGPLPPAGMPPLPGGGSPGPAGIGGLLIGFPPYGIYETIRIG
jgi:hypothetical protein